MSSSLFVISNREFRRDRNTGNYTLGDRPNRLGASELRLFEARPVGTDLDQWSLEIVPDRPQRRHFNEYGVQPLIAKSGYSGSDLVAARVAKRLGEEKCNVLLFIHGYNTAIEDALSRAWRLAERYQLHVLVFSWPANGGGNNILEDIHGLASYLSDKSDARSSTEALDRALSRLHLLTMELNQSAMDSAQAEAKRAFPNSPGQRRELLARLLRERACPFNVSLLAHSMGNYLYKKMLLSSSERLSAKVVFDNVILKAADTNHEGHAGWVEQIRVRRRVYITINQNDSALGWSTRKTGDEQKPRLGSTLARQNAANATYLDLTSEVADSHSYFFAEDLDGTSGSKALERFFQQALNGEIADTGLAYQAASNTYRLG